jgi:hypothetical protein
MELADDGCAVAERTENLGQKQRILSDLSPAEGGADTYLPSISTGQKGCARWSAPRRRPEVRKHDALAGEGIKVRCLHDGRSSK